MQRPPPLTDVVDSISLWNQSGSAPLDPDTPAVKWDLFQVQIAWSVPAAADDDTFGITYDPPSGGDLSEPFLIHSATVNIEDPTRPGVTLGTCTIGTTGASCEFNDQVSGLVNLSGTIAFTVQFTRTSTVQQEITFLVDGTPVPLTTPAVDPRPLEPLPAATSKSGWDYHGGGKLSWQFTIPGFDLTSDLGDVTIADRFDASLTLDEGSFQVLSMPMSDYQEFAYDWGRWDELDEGTGPGEYTFTDRPADHGFDVLIHNPDTAAPGSSIPYSGTVYRIYYETFLPNGAEPGDEFLNTATGFASGPVERIEVYDSASATGSGTFRRFLVTKEVVAEDGVVGLTGVEYSVEYWVDDIPAGLLTIEDGQTSDPERVPRTATVCLAELPVASPPPGAVFGTPVLEIISAGGIDTVTPDRVGDRWCFDSEDFGTTAEIRLINPVSASEGPPTPTVPPGPPTTTPTPTPTPSTTPTTSAPTTPTTAPAPTVPGGHSVIVIGGNNPNVPPSELAFTGPSDRELGLAGGGIALIGAGLALALMTNRRRAV